MDIIVNSDFFFFNFQVHVLVLSIRGLKYNSHNTCRHKLFEKDLKFLVYTFKMQLLNVKT